MAAGELIGPVGRSILAVLSARNEFGSQPNLLWRSREVIPSNMAKSCVSAHDALPISIIHNMRALANSHVI
jgi:hypothetical protein